MSKKREAVQDSACRGFSERPAAYLSPLVLVLHQQGEGDTAACRVNLHHAHLHDVAATHNVVRVRHVAAAHLRDVHEAVLVHTNIHERTECRHVRDRTLEHHAGAHVLEVRDGLGEAGGAEATARVQAGAA